MPRDQVFINKEKRSCLLVDFEIQIIQSQVEDKTKQKEKN